MIIGGAGYVGYELTKLFVANGDAVCVVDNFSNGDVEARQKIIDLQSVVVCDDSIVDHERVTTLIEEFHPDIVYNLAALHYIPYCIEHPDEVFDTNYRGLQYIIQALRPHPETKFIFASSASVYGSPNRQCNLDTATKPNDIYGASKLAGEGLIRHQLTNYVVMRLFNVYGNLDPHPHLIPKVAQAAVRNDNLELGTATAERDFVHVTDVANAFFIARQSQPGETHIIASGETHSVSDTVDMIYELAGSTGKVRYETPDNMREKDASYLSGDASTLRVLGWTPKVNFETGLRSAIDAARRRDTKLFRA